MALINAAEIDRPNKGISSQDRQVVLPQVAHAEHAHQADQRRQRDTASQPGLRRRAGRSGAGPVPPSTASQVASDFERALLMQGGSGGAARRRRCPKAPLHQHHVQPAVELPARALEQASIGSKPRRRCTPTEPRLALSPITASIWRAPAASQRASVRPAGQGAHTAAAGPRVQVDRVFQAEAVGPARPEMVGIGIAQHLARRRSATSQGRPLDSTSPGAGHLGLARRRQVRRCRCRAARRGHRWR